MWQVRLPDVFGGVGAPSTVEYGQFAGLVKGKIGRNRKMRKTRDLQATPESQLFTITQIATDRKISRDRVIHVVRKKLKIPRIGKIGNTNVYSLPHRKMIEAELDRIAARKGQ